MLYTMTVDVKHRTLTESDTFPAKDAP